jgi:hypothetical protein
VVGQDRDRDRRRREELRGRKHSHAGLTELEKAEYMKLEELFREEDRDHDRLGELSWKQFYAEIGRDPLTDEEVQELAGLKLRYPPDPNDPLLDTYRGFAPSMNAKAGVDSDFGNPGCSAKPSSREELLQRGCARTRV